MFKGCLPPVQCLKSHSVLPQATTHASPDFVSTVSMVRGVWLAKNLSWKKIGLGMLLKTA